MRRSHLGAGVLLLAVGGAVLGSVSAAQAATRPMASTNGCSNGTACIYDDAGWQQGNPENYWVNYGCYNLNNEYGDRYVFNNQYGGATVTLWTGSNCSGTPTTIGQGHTWQGNITPINSVSLNK